MHQALSLLVWSIVGVVFVVSAAMVLAVVRSLVMLVLGKGYWAPGAGEQEVDEDEAHDDAMTAAMTVVLAHGDTMHQCPACKSTQTTIEKVGYRYERSIGAMAVIVHEVCNECSNEINYLMTSVGWVAAVAHTEWGMWMLAQDSSNLHLDITDDLGNLGVDGLDGPVG